MNKVNQHNQYDVHLANISLTSPSVHVKQKALIIHLIYKFLNFIRQETNKIVTKKLSGSIKIFKKINNNQFSNDCFLSKLIKKINNIKIKILTNFEKGYSYFLFKPRIKFDTLNSKNYYQSHFHLGKKSLALTYCIDWNKDHPLFDPTFTFDWIHSHSMIDLPNLDFHKHQQFISFLKQLTDDNPIIKDHYGKELSQENVERIRQMIFAIMNLIKEEQKTNNFEKKYIIVVTEICNALDNCSNAMNTAIESLFYQLSFPSEGNIGQKVELCLQKLRDTIFRKSIQTVLQRSDRADYYLKHEAASFNYYYANTHLSTTLGLPLSVSALDKKWQKYALKDQEYEIIKLFYQNYTPNKIIDTIYDVICDVYDQQIPVKVFTDWILNQPNVPQDQIIDENGQYNKWCVAYLLEKLQIIKHQ